MAPAVRYPGAIMQTLSRRTVLIVVAVLVVAAQRKFFPSVDTTTLIAGLMTLAGWVIGDSIAPVDLPEGANKWLHLVKEPRFQAFLGGALITGFQLAGVPIDEPTSLVLAGLITTWIVGNSYRSEPTPLIGTGVPNVRSKTKRRS